MVATLQAHGFTARSERRQCASGTVANITNGPTDNESDERTLREGHVLCLVQEEPWPRASLQRSEDSGKVAWSVGNVDCAVYFTSEEKEAQVGRLQTAMLDLARMVR